MYKKLTKTLFTGHNLVYLTSCHSTNEYAAQLLSDKSTPDGTVVITNNQTSGKGQRGNIWESLPNRNLTFSIIYKPTFLLPRNNFWLNPTLSLAITDFLTEYMDHGVRIKWPNDIYVNDLKIAGILIENSIYGNVITHSIIGIGLNVNQREFERFPATSLSQETQLDFDLSEVLSRLLSRVEARYLQLRSDGWIDLKGQYLELLYRFNQPHYFKSGEIFEGTIIGVDDTGRLEIRKTDDVTETFDFKEVEYL